MKKKVLVLFLAVIVIIPILFIAERYHLKNKPLYRLTIAGNDIPNESINKLEKTLEKIWSKKQKPSIKFNIDGQKEKLNLKSWKPDFKKTADFIIKNPREINFNNTIKRILLGKNINWITTFDKNELDQEVYRIVEKYSKKLPQNANIEFRDNQYIVIDEVVGTGLDEIKIYADLKNKLKKYVNIKSNLKTGTINPSITSKKANQLLALANDINNKEYQITVNEKTKPIPKNSIKDALFIDPTTKSINIYKDKLRKNLSTYLSEFETPGKDATFDTTNPNQVTIIPSIQGTYLDYTKLIELILKSESSITINTINEKPLHEEEWAKKLNITKLVGSFTTKFPAGQPRVKNIARGAELVNNHIVEPGETFSLNNFIGKRTIENGFVNAPVFDGQKGFTQDIGGGLSQYTTTLFNAVFFGGYEILEHTPHSIYITRYPMGREATINYGSIDLKFKNNTNSGILIQNVVTATSITVNLFGDNLGRVITAEGPIILGTTPVATKYVDDPSLPVGTTKLKGGHAGTPGYSVINYRIIKQPGKPDIKEKYAWNYTMFPNIYLKGTGQSSTTSP